MTTYTTNSIRLDIVFLHQHPTHFEVTDLSSDDEAGLSTNGIRVSRVEPAAIRVECGIEQATDKVETGRLNCSRQPEGRK